MDLATGRIAGSTRLTAINTARNSRSRAAISGLGATLEGALRHHMVMRDGWIRDSAVHSITRPERPDVKRQLTERLARRG
ncbi:GNAT family N-acetyltransferase [Streptomyces sp. NRRL F-2580]|uniref:GNAT family N-acetyltransferase n=1 Tax=Streptomyces sp. NRRL F-2580 TaxID=1463841 RepID=UPI0004C6F5E3|nr:GNAT family protein [Streptomyces sp. NRRL F-2580]